MGIDNLYSAYPDLAGKTLDWLPMDKEELFRYNLSNKKHLLDQYGWTDKSIKYQFNSAGFRTGEFKDCDCAVFLGCSYTIGIGLPYHNTWPLLVAEELGLECYNLGLGNGSWDGIYRIGSYWIEKLNPKIVFILEPPGVRYEVLPFGTVSVYNESKFKDTLWANLFQYQENYDLNKQKNISAIKTLHKNIVILENNQNNVDLARDLVHPGIQTNILIKEKALGLVP